MPGFVFSFFEDYKVYFDFSNIFIQTDNQFVFGSQKGFSRSSDGI